MQTAHPRSRQRWLIRGLALATLMAVSTGCWGTWGLRQSYRNYITSPIAGGSIATEPGATWLDGPGSGKGPFQWDFDWSTFDVATETGSVQLKGGVHTKGHAFGGGYLLDTSFWNPRLDIAGDTGTLYADLNYRPSAGSPPALQNLVAAPNTAFATVDLSGEDFTPDADGFVTISDAPMTGIPAAMTLIGWDAFYPNPVALDPYSVRFKPEWAPVFINQPTVTVSQTTDLRVGDVITVWGKGFDPAGNIGTRPPFSGQPAGVYATFGKFTDPWQPSTGAPSANRPITSQKWAVPAATRALIDPAGTNPSFVTIDAYGRWKATLTIGTSAAATGDYGVYVYPGSGAVNPAHEIETLTTFAP